MSSRDLLSCRCHPPADARGRDASEFRDLAGQRFADAILLSSKPDSRPPYRNCHPDAPLHETIHLAPLSPVEGAQSECERRIPEPCPADRCRLSLQTTPRKTSDRLPACRKQRGSPSHPRLLRPLAVGRTATRADRPGV